MQNLERDINSLFGDLFNFEKMGYVTFENQIDIPVDVITHDDKYELNLMIPDFKKKNIDINLENDLLRITGERKADKKIKFLSKNSFYGTFEKKYKLYKNIDQENIKSELKDGVLKIILPKTENSLKRSINIE